jgi:hypothetical protein
VTTAAEGVRAAIQSHGTKSPILAAAHAGPRMTHACGLSIFFPPALDPSHGYRTLDFARRTRWADFLEALLGEGR